MSTTKEITLEEARNLYNSSNKAKEFLLTKFSKEELEGKNNIPSQEEFNNFFEENILTLIDYSKMKFLDKDGIISKYPTNRIELRNFKDEWLFDYKYDSKKPHFWYSFDHVFLIFQNKFSLQDVDRHRLMKSQVEKHFNLVDTQPYINSFPA